MCRLRNSVSERHAGFFGAEEKIQTVWSSLSADSRAAWIVLREFLRRDDDANYCVAVYSHANRGLVAAAWQSYRVCMLGVTCITRRRTGSESNGKFRTPA